MTEGNDYEYDEYVYQAFGFEHPIYLFVWEILVCVATLIGILFTLTLLQKKLRGVTSYLLCAIVVADCLTGIVTLPTYIMVYKRLEKGVHYFTDYDYNDTSFNQSDQYTSTNGLGSIYSREEDASKHESAGTDNYYNQQSTYDAYILDDKLCEAFMISKFFLSKAFHTFSIWLTVFLGVQRWLSVRYPFTAPRWFTIKKTFVICFAIVILSAVLHGFHLFHKKAVEGFCAWKLWDDCSGGSCVQFWATFTLRHFIPCVILSVTTGLMVKSLVKSSFKSTRTKSIKKFQSGSEVLEDEHQLVSRIVTAIVIVFLITEVPYGIFLFYVSLERTFNNNNNNNLATNRAIHATYEITMALSFNANFCIYTIFNRRFRGELKRLIFCDCRQPRKTGQPSHSSSHSQSQYVTEMSTLVTT